MWMSAVRKPVAGASELALPYFELGWIQQPVDRKHKFDRKSFLIHFKQRLDFL